ncbi:hypothetical protein K2Z84_12140 [Candidatus Binatia bacterium]|jgi:hypothetical protein|nr:hypothetical protein [Candidatus Binatia bacterium]
MANIDDILRDLRTRRDELKVRIHLGSQEAQDEWHRLEERWNEFAAKAHVEDSAEGISSALGLLKEELVRGYERVRNAL